MKLRGGRMKENVLDIKKEFGPKINKIFNEELATVDARFREDIQDILFKRGLNLENTPSDIISYYPFWLGQSFNIPEKDKIIQSLGKFNFWFGFHILIQDDLIDQNRFEKNSYKKILYSDYFLLNSMLRLKELATDNETTAFEHILRLYSDYIECILTEKAHLNLQTYRYSEMDLESAGKKFAPLQINNYIFSSLSGSKDYLVNLNLFIEYLHMYMQIIDDIKDWKIDLLNNNITYFLAEVIERYHLHGQTEKIDLFEETIRHSDIVQRMANKGLEYLLKAESVIKPIGNPYLNKFILEQKGNALWYIHEKILETQDPIDVLEQILLKSC
jgi:hypothetical protein